MVQLLLDAGAASDVDLQCSDGMRPVDYALQWARDDISELLLGRVEEASN
jgi:hypothetical protein